MPLPSFVLVPADEGRLRARATAVIADEHASVNSSTCMPTDGLGNCPPSQRALARRAQQNTATYKLCVLNDYVAGESTTEKLSCTLVL